MPEWDDIKTYISEDLELPIDSITQESLVMDLLCDSKVHEDEVTFFMLNFLDHYKIYCEERDLNKNYDLPRNVVVRFVTYPVYWFLNVIFHGHVDYLHLTAKNLLEMANSKKWIYLEPTVYPEPKFLEPKPGQPMLVLKLPGRRNNLTAFVEELASLEMQKLNWFPDATGGAQTSFDWAVSFLFDDTLLSKVPQNEIGWFLYTVEEAEAIKKMTEALDEILNRYGDIDGSEYLDKPEWGLIVSVAKVASDLVQKNNKLAIDSKIGS